MSTVNKGRACTICEHPSRASLELGVANRVPVRTLSRRFGVSPDAVHRHKHRHMAPQLIAQLMVRGKVSEIDLEKLRITESEGLLHHLVAVRGRLYAALDQSEDLGDYLNTARVSATLLKNLELTAKLLGELHTGAQVTQNILVLPEYHGLRTAILQALKGHPEARNAVVAALHTFEMPEVPALEGEVRRVVAGS